MGEIDAIFSTPVSKINAPTPSTSSSSAGNYIEHTVCKTDTLSGIAIKYGVEVADVRRLNGLVTDLQMFARRSLHIPLPGRHPASPVKSNVSQINRKFQYVAPFSNSAHLFTRLEHNCRDKLSQKYISNPFHSPKLRYKQTPIISPAMSSLQGYYGLTPPKQQQPRPEGTLMAVYKPSEKELGQYQETTELEAEDRANGEKTQSEKSVRRRQKVDADPSFKLDILVKDDVGSSPTGISIKGLDSGARADVDIVQQNLNLGENTLTFGALLVVNKSSSTSNLQESEYRAPFKSSKWAFKADSISKPILEGLQKPLIAWRSKTALD